MMAQRFGLHFFSFSKWHDAQSLFFSLFLNIERPIQMTLPPSFPPPTPKKLSVYVNMIF